MANKIFASNAGTSIYAYDLDLNTWTVVATGAPTTASQRCCACWDGAYFYFFAADSKLYRMDPTSFAITVMNSNVALSGSPIQSCACDGTYIWWANATTFGQYSIPANSSQTLSKPWGSHEIRLCWDYGNSIYAAWIDPTLANNEAFRYDMTTGLWTAQVAPPINSGADIYQGCWYANGKLWIHTRDTGGTFRINSIAAPNGVSWAQVNVAAAGGSLIPFRLPIDSDKILDQNATYYRLSDNTDTALAGGGGPGSISCAAYTLNIQSVFTFLEADGVTPQSSPEVIGGSLARFYAGQSSGIFTYAIKSAFPRNSVAIAIVPNAGIDIVANMQIAPSVSGPWGTSANLGAFSANQVKPYYMRFNVPNPTAPGTKQFNLLATST